MSCVHKHEQQRYNNENTKKCMFIHYIYVDIIFHLTKAIPNMFERVITHYQTLHTWIGHNAMRYHTHYRTFSLSLVWFWEYFANGLPTVTIRFLKNIYHFFRSKLTVTRGNALQIVQKHANFKENI